MSVYKEKKTQTKQDEVEDKEPAKAVTSTKATDKLDDLLAEIDELLEPEAEEFVNAFVQKGGQ